MIEILISRGILSGRYDDPIRPVYGISASDYRWRCYVLKPELLFQTNRDVLLTEIHEASKLISQITNKPCHILNLHFIHDSRNYRILESIGCIRAKEYYAFNVEICDYDIIELHVLAANKQSIEQILKCINPDSESQTNELVKKYKAKYAALSCITFQQGKKQNKSSVSKLPQHILDEIYSHVFFSSIHSFFKRERNEERMSDNWISYSYELPYDQINKTEKIFLKTLKNTFEKMRMFPPKISTDLQSSSATDSIIGIDKLMSNSPESTIPITEHFDYKAEWRNSP